MKCPRCKYVSFDFLDSCKKCGKDLIEIKAKHNIVTFRPVFIPVGDAAFNIAYPAAADAVAKEEPLLEIGEESEKAPAEPESTVELQIERTRLTLEEDDIVELEEEAVGPAMAIEEKEGLLMGDETMDGTIGIEEDLGKTLSAEEALGTEQEGIIGEDTLGATMVDSDEKLDAGATMDGLVPGDVEQQSPRFIGGEPELELDMEAFEVPSMPTEEPTPSGGIPLKVDMESMDDQAPAQEQDTNTFEKTMKITSSPIEDAEAMEKGTESPEEGSGIYELEITEEDLKSLEDNK
ncbi:MAG: hypothetical protein JRG73_01170 [Deltaproteobacteria bacterium]|nr:hypothetical protein [Deltaproteobacteria bacterium]MBW2305515.1 hypothetical protein [Deltaproteobacteria bacterium]